MKYTELQTKISELLQISDSIESDVYNCKKNDDESIKTAYKTLMKYKATELSKNIDKFYALLQNDLNAIELNINSLNIK